MTGASAGVDRDVYFTGASYRKWHLAPMKLVDLDQRATARFDRVSYLYHVTDSAVSPFVRLGFERVRAEHTVRVQAFGFALARTEEKQIVAPYLGVGLTLGRGRPWSYRVEYQIESLPPHQLTTLTVGVIVTLW